MTVDQQPLLRVDDLCVLYGKAVALDAVSFEVAHGELYGLIGPNGAGKTTLIEAVTGFVPISRGEVVFAGERLNDLRPEQRARRGIVRTFQSLELFEELTVLENLLVGSDRRSWAGSLRSRRADGAAALTGTMAPLGLVDLFDLYPPQLSNGQRKLVALGRVVASRARMMLLDEPAAGLDTHESQELGRHLRALADAGWTMLLVDHDMDLVLSICDRILVLDFGATIAEGSPEAIRVSPRVVEAYLGSPAGAAPVDGEANGHG